MFEVKIIDRNKPIVSLKWSGIVTKKEALDVIPELLKLEKEVGRNWYFLVDTSEMKINDATAEFTEHQKATLQLIKKIAVVNQSRLTKLQLRKMAKDANNDKDHFFESYEEALAWLKRQP